MANFSHESMEAPISRPEYHGHKWPTTAARLHAMTAAATPQWATSGSSGLAAARHIPTPDEVAAPIVFLCSERACAITGSVLVIDAGLHLQQLA